MINKKKNLNDSFKIKMNDVINKLSPEEQELLFQIIGIEKSKLYMFRPVGVNEEIVEAIKGKILK